MTEGLMASVAENTQEEVAQTDGVQAQVANDTGRPEYLPEQFWDSESNTAKVEDIFKAYQAEEKKAKDFRRIISKGLPEAPDSEDGYVFEHETYKDYIKPDDPVVKSLKSVFHKKGIPNEVFNETIASALDAMKEAGVLPQSLSKEEMEALQAEQSQKYVKEEMAKLGDGGERLVQQVAAWGDQLVKSGQLSENELKAFYDVGYTADGVKLLNKLRSLTGEKPIPMENINSDGLPSVEEWRAMHDMEKMKDESYREKVFGIGLQLKKRGLI